MSQEAALLIPSILNFHLEELPGIIVNVTFDWLKREHCHGDDHCTSTPPPEFLLNTIDTTFSKS